MKRIILNVKTPKCGASSEALRSALAVAIGADEDLVGANLSIVPPDVKQIIQKAARTIKETWDAGTLPWIGNERVCADEKADIVIEEIEEVTKKAVAIIEEQAKAMTVWLPKVKKALGKGADLVELPVVENFRITVTHKVVDPSKAGRGLPKDATEAQIAEAQGKAAGYESVIDHLITLAGKVGPGKKGSEAALRLKEDMATATKLGAVNSDTIKKLNTLVTVVLAAGKGGTKQKAARAALVTGLAESQTKVEIPTADAKKEPTKNKTAPKVKRVRKVAELLSKPADGSKPAKKKALELV